MDDKVARFYYESNDSLNHNSLLRWFFYTPCDHRFRNSAFCSLSDYDKRDRNFYHEHLDKKKSTLFFTLNRFKSHNIKSEELRKFKKTNLCFRIYCIFWVVNFIAKLIGTIIKSFTMRSFKNQRMIVIFPNIMAIQAFLILTSTPYFFAILRIIQNLIEFSIRTSPPVHGDIINLRLIIRIVSQFLIILKIFL